MPLKPINQKIPQQFRKTQNIPFPWGMWTHLMHHCLPPPPLTITNGSLIGHALSHNYVTKPPLVTMKCPLSTPQNALPVGQSPTSTKCLILGPSKPTKISHVSTMHRQTHRVTDTQTTDGLSDKTCSNTHLCSIDGTVTWLIISLPTYPRVQINNQHTMLPALTFLGTTG